MAPAFFVQQELLMTVNHLDDATVPVTGDPVP